MTDLQTLAGGVVVCGFEGTELLPPVRRSLEDLRLAGIVLFARNTQTVEQTRALTDALRSALDRPIVAIDQEGGRVMRLRAGVSAVPPMREIGARGDAAQAERIGAVLGADLRRAGVNLDFAPVLDLALFETNTVIGDRSFGSDPSTVTLLGGAVARGLRSQGIVPTFKHFPGHGSTDVDTHVDLPRVRETQATLRSRDLVPFAALLPQAQAVMTSHVILEAFDPDAPATLSQRILTGLLRDEMRFSGVCFTDCMEMDAIAKHTGSAAGAVRALAAGADCVVISHHLDVARESIDAIVRAVGDGTLPETRLREAYDRVCTLRAALC